MTMSATLDHRPGRAMLWTGRIVSGILVALLLTDAAMKLVIVQPVIDASAQLGWPTDPVTVRTLGAILAPSTLFYALPRTAVLGAILLTGYLGGAIATHLRIADPLFTHTLFGVYVGVALWGGLWLRDRRIRALIPLAH